ncbi:hypothetical protein O6H91_04G021300 [Diphasiastrum complanatum]|nr:hypothetical protein O6H91_04G021300 [Diphasiastrum complanatum]
MSRTVLGGSLRNAFSYCVQQVRTYDYENYLCLLQLPEKLRTAAFAIRAFNVEIAKVKESAHETNLALMRLLWWQEAINGIYAKSPVGHPVVKALEYITQEHRLNKHWFSRIIEARIADAEITTSPVNIADVEHYAESTASTLLYLTLEAAGIRNTNADHAASHIGKAAGLALLLRASPFHVGYRRSYIPLELLAKHRFSEEEIYRGKETEALCNAVFELASVANSHLEKARQLSNAVPPEAFPVLLPAVPAGVLLKSLQQCGFNIFDQRLQRGVCGISPLMMQLKIKWQSLCSTY